MASLLMVPVHAIYASSCRSVATRGRRQTTSVPLHLVARLLGGGRGLPGIRWRHRGRDERRRKGKKKRGGKTRRRGRRSGNACRARSVFFPRFTLALHCSTRIIATRFPLHVFGAVDALLGRMVAMETRRGQRAPSHAGNPQRRRRREKKRKKKKKKHRRRRRETPSLHFFPPFLRLPIPSLDRLSRVADARPSRTPPPVSAERCAISLCASSSSSFFFFFFFFPSS